jgi:hypothetical protein
LSNLPISAESFPVNFRYKLVINPSSIMNFLLGDF